MSCDCCREFCCANCSRTFPIEEKLEYKKCFFCSPKCAERADKHLTDPVNSMVHQAAGVLYYGAKHSHYLDFATILGYWVDKIIKLKQPKQEQTKQMSHWEAIEILKNESRHSPSSLVRLAEAISVIISDPSSTTYEIQLGLAYPGFVREQAVIALRRRGLDFKTITGLLIPDSPARAFNDAFERFLSENPDAEHVSVKRESLIWILDWIKALGVVVDDSVASSVIKELEINLTTDEGKCVSCNIEEAVRKCKNGHPQCKWCDRCSAPCILCENEIKNKN